MVPTTADWPRVELSFLQMALLPFIAIRTKTRDRIGVIANIDQLGLFSSLSVSIFVIVRI